MAIANQLVESVLRRCLITEGYALTLPKANGETGVDLIASKDKEQIYIEVIGFKDRPPARSKDFYEVFFRAVSRLKSGATSIAIALPERFARGLNQRAAVYGPAWFRLAAAFPEISVWLVNCVDPESYRRTTWAEWLPNQALHLTAAELSRQAASHDNLSAAR